jgi:hypothetical protein
VGMTAGNNGGLYGGGASGACGADSATGPYSVAGGTGAAGIIIIEF